MELLTILLQAAEFEIFGAPLWDSEDFWKLLAKAIFNLFIITIIIRYLYYPVTKNKDYLFTYFFNKFNSFYIVYPIR